MGTPTATSARGARLQGLCQMRQAARHVASGSGDGVHDTWAGRTGEKLWSQKPFKPWACPVPTIIPVVPGCERRGEEELEAMVKCRRLDAFYRAYDTLPKAAMTVCMDGSAAKGRCPPTTVNGRAGVVWQAEGLEDMMASFAAGTYASSFSAEYLALAKGLEGLVDLSRSGALPSGPIHMLTDSQSVLVVMQQGPTCQTYVAGVQAWRHLHTLHRAGHSDVVLHFVPVHVGHLGNEAADREAVQPDEDEAKRHPCRLRQDAQTACAGDPFQQCPGGYQGALL